jgi:hypothetical protein
VQTSLQINTKDEVLCPDWGELSELVLLLGSISKNWGRNGLYAVLYSMGGGESGFVDEGKMLPPEHGAGVEFVKFGM